MAKLPPNFTETANQRFLEANRFWANWVGGARDDYEFIAGNQWLPDDERILTEQKRPPITFNYSEKMIDAVVGAEVSNRQEVTYKPREKGDAPLAELWTNAAKWVRDEGNIEDEETDAFRDCLICGMGWTHTRMNYEVEADGMIDTSRVDPLEMRADPSATKPGLIDRRYNFRLQWVDERLAKRYWPSSVAFATTPEGDNTGIDTITRGQRYEGDGADDDPDMHRGQVQIRHYECVELEPFYRVANETGIVEMSSEEFTSTLKEAFDAAGIKYVKQFKRVYYYAYFANETLLEGDKSPTQVGFTYQCITGKRDRNKNYWYGLTRVMKDPQRWANKWLSQILHIINSNAKGGLLAEVGAFVDSQRAQDEWARPESITFLKEGGLKKIEQKQVVNYPTGLDRLMEFALASLPQVTGINLEALGLAAREQANVLEQSRKQAAYGLLAPVFDSLRRYRKNQGRVLLDFIHNYISDNRLIRIGGPDSQQFVPLTKAPKAPRYDIIVDQSPQSPDAKQKTWEILESILPNMMKAGLPIPPDLLDYTPLPTAMVLKWKQFIAQTGGVTPEQMAKLNEELQKAQEQNQQLQLKLKDKSQELAIKVQESQIEMQIKREEAMHKLRIAYIELEQKLLMAKAEFQLEHAESEATIEIAQQKQKAEARQAHETAILDAMAKITTALAQLEAEAEADKKVAAAKPKKE